MQKSKYSTSLYLIKLLSITAVLSIGHAIASHDFEGFEIIPSATKIPVYKKIDLPAQLTYDQVQDLKTKSLQLGTITLTADEPQELYKSMPGSWRIITNYLNAKTEAKSLNTVAYDNEHLSVFHATYKFANGIEFSVTGVDDNLKDALMVRNIDIEAAEIDAQMMQHPVVNLHVGFIQWNADTINNLRVNYVANSFADKLVSNTDSAITTDHYLALKKAAFNVGLHVFSVVAKSLIKQQFKQAADIYPQAEFMAKTLGFPTITHMMVDMAQNGGKLKAPLLENKNDKDNHIACALFDTAAGKEPELSVRRDLHALSNGLGYAVSFIPWGPAVRTVGTMYVERQGYPTLTHYFHGYKEMTNAQISEINNSQTKLTEELVALGVETFIPYGGLLVTISHAGAYVCLDEPSITSYLAKKLTSTPLNARDTVLKSR